MLSRFRRLRRSSRKPCICEKCKISMTSIVYGMPGGELMDAASRGEVILGGCVTFPDLPTWRCRVCGHEKI